MKATASKNIHQAENKLNCDYVKVKEHKIVEIIMK